MMKVYFIFLNVRRVGSAPQALSINQPPLALYKVNISSIEAYIGSRWILLTTCFGFLPL